jgi:2-amino-4-hydroxy-6-hydroxymethyldihydropteridine diphosphokinase
VDKIAIRAYIALGSNLANPVLQVQEALKLISQLPDSTLVATSSLYRSAPLGPPEQAYYINAVAAIDTLLSAHELLNKLQKLEQAQGRVEKPIHWGPRTLDLDLLLYGNKTINTPNLIVPHPEMKERNFVLYPLAEIAPDLLFPNKQSLKDIITGSTTAGLERLTKS